MNQFKRLVLTAACFIFTATVWAGNPKPKIEKQPAWVSPITVDYTNTSLDDEAEDGYVDLHYEKQVSLALQETFLKKAAHILSETGVESLSQISVDYDPSYEQLTFHSVRIIRGGQSINQLQLSRIKTLQQEKELDRSIYNGTLTAVLILEDLRKGDVLEYSYTITGFNPIFKNKYAENYSTKFDVPIYGLYYRLLLPKGRSITLANSLTDSHPTITGTANETVYQWSINNQHALPPAEKNLPSWYDVYPMIRVSETCCWKDVNDWALELFPFSTPLSGGLQKKIEEIKKAHSSTEDCLLAALHFVQDDVRYMGIEMGENSHKPHQPSLVFSQRFGDCKDKAYLLCTLLRALNIEAYPVLINTTYKKAISGWLPSPTAFDHTTVCAVLNGKSYWLDATISYQKGRLNDISFPNYQIGLIIKPGTTNLTSIPLQSNGKVTTKEAFFVKNGNKAVDFVVTTIYTGSFADNMRYGVHSDSKKELQKQFKDLYTPYFKKLDADSLAYEDNEITGAFTTKEYYTVRDFWKEEGGHKTASLAPYLLNSVIKKPEDEKRQMPFSLSYPANYEEQIEVSLPDDWPVTESSNHFKTTAFVLDCEYKQARKDLVQLNYTYRSLQDHVAAEDVPAYLSELESSEKNLGFGLSDDFSRTPTAFNPAAIDRDSRFTLAYILLGVCAAATFLYRRTIRRRSY